MSEANLQRRIKEALTALGDKVEKIHTDIYQTRGTPDLLCCCQGRCVMIEVKLPGNKPTQKQMFEMLAWEKAGATVGVAYSVEDALLIRERAINEPLL